MGKITSELLKALAPSTPKAKRDRFIPYFNEALPRYGITNKKRVAAFMATVVMESDYLKATEEYASGQAYDITVNRKKAVELGNTEKGDGVKYKGRTLIQTTGKNNYQRLSDKLGVDFVANPKKLAQPQYAVEGACVYWQDNKLNSYADAEEFTKIQGLVNRGDANKTAKDLPKRKTVYTAAMNFLPNDFTLDNSEDATPAEDTTATTDTGTTTNTDNTDTGGTTTTTTTSTDGQSTTSNDKEKVAVIATPKPKFWQRIYMKIAGALTGNVLVTTLSDKMGALTGFHLSPDAWLIIIITIVVMSIIWITFEAVKVIQERNKQKEIDKVLLEQNSTPNNIVQLVDQEDATLFAAKGWRIVNRGIKLPDDVTTQMAKEIKKDE